MIVRRFARSACRQRRTRCIADCMTEAAYFITPGSSDCQRNGARPCAGWPEPPPPLSSSPRLDGVRLRCIRRHTSSAPTCAARATGVELDRLGSRRCAPPALHRTRSSRPSRPRAALRHVRPAQAQQPLTPPARGTKSPAHAAEQPTANNSDGERWLEILSMTTSDWGVARAARSSSAMIACPDPYGPVTNGLWSSNHATVLALAGSIT